MSESANLTVSDEESYISNNIGCTRCSLPVDSKPVCIHRNKVRIMSNGVRARSGYKNTTVVVKGTTVIHGGLSILHTNTSCPLITRRIHSSYAEAGVVVRCTRYRLKVCNEHNDVRREADPSDSLITASRTGGKVAYSCSEDVRTRESHIGQVSPTDDGVPVESEPIGIKACSVCIVAGSGCAATIETEDSVRQNSTNYV